MSDTFIVTHRGLEPSNTNFFSESSLEAFHNHLERGFSVEYDANFSKDGIVVFHDKTLEIITKGKDKRLISDATTKEITSISLEKGRLCSLNELMDLIMSYDVEPCFLHMKGIFQNEKNIGRLMDILKFYGSKMFQKIVIFDLNPDSAQMFKSKYSTLRLAASVSDDYDIERYNKYVSGTLISVSTAVKNKDLYEWIWLDEWDRNGRSGATKKLYTEHTFSLLRKHNFLISLVTPELHATSPHLLGNESHQDARDERILFQRIRDILLLKPDAVCTDYPEEVKQIASQL